MAELNRLPQKQLIMTTKLISATKANSLYWLGRYEERVYITLHMLRKCYDRMIDSGKEDYDELWTRLDVNGIYRTTEAFSYGMMYDEKNIASVISAQTRAMDNAIVLREDITSETLSYLEMSMALIKECKKRREANMTALQPIVDWSLAFWGSAEQRLRNHNALYIMTIGRNIENLDMLLRFEYPYGRIALGYESLLRYIDQMPTVINKHIEEQLSKLITEELFNLRDIAYKNELLVLINLLVKI